MNPKIIHFRAVRILYKDFLKYSTGSLFEKEKAGCVWGRRQGEGHRFLPKGSDLAFVFLNYSWQL